MRLRKHGAALRVVAPAALAAAVALCSNEALAASGNGSSGDAAISADGRYVAFASAASDLVPSDRNGVFDVFVRDRVRGTTERVSVGPGGAEANARSGLADISADGRFVVIWSEASNLVAGDTNGLPDVFVRDRVARTTERVSVGAGGAEADGESAHGSVSADGRIVAFASSAPNLGGSPTSGFRTYVRDRGTGTTELVGTGWAPSLDASGRYVAFAASGGAIVVRDRVRDVSETASLDAGGAALPGVGSVPTISADGRFVAFLMYVEGRPGNRLSILYVRDRQLRTTGLVGVEAPENPTISADGRTVAFSSHGQVYVRELATGETEHVSVSSTGEHGNGSSYTGSGPIGADGRLVAFFSLATNLVAPDANGTNDVFVHDVRTRITQLVSAAVGRQLRVQRATVSPKRPAPGGRFTVTLRVASEDGPVPAAAVHCVARAAATVLRPATAQFGASTARCTWRVPVRSQGARLRGTISVVTAHGRLVRTFAVRVR